MKASGLKHCLARSHQLVDANGLTWVRTGIGDMGTFPLHTLVSSITVPNIAHAGRPIVNPRDVHRDRRQPLEGHGPGIGLVFHHDR